MLRFCQFCYSNPYNLWNFHNRNSLISCISCNQVESQHQCYTYILLRERMNKLGQFPVLLVSCPVLLLFHLLPSRHTPLNGYVKSGNKKVIRNLRVYRKWRCNIIYIFLPCFWIIPVTCLHALPPSEEMNTPISVYESSEPMLPET